jgi:hypothetical protein
MSSDVSRFGTAIKTAMDQSLESQIQTYLAHLNGLIGRGQELRDALMADPADAATVAAMRRWQEDCGVTINQLSGGSKAHWLARSFSQAFLMRAADGRAVESAAPAELAQQLLGVLGQAVASLTATDDNAITAASSSAPPPRRFEFVHNAELRPVLEQAYSDSRTALTAGDYQIALMTACGILEAIVTDALEHKGSDALNSYGAPAGKLADWSFDTRIAVAEKTGLIRGGCARLPQVARHYRERMNAEGEIAVTATVTERDARTTGQVLHVIMRDLDPGR